MEKGMKKGMKKLRRAYREWCFFQRWRWEWWRQAYRCIMKGESFKKLGEIDNKYMLILARSGNEYYKEF
jgi:hypothetical protein